MFKCPKFKKKKKKYCFILTFRAGNNPWGKDMSASQYGAATLSADHHLRADLLHMSEKRKMASGILLLNLKNFHTHSGPAFLLYLGPLTGSSSTSGICEWVRICTDVSSADELHICCFNNNIIIIISLVVHDWSSTQKVILETLPFSALLLA